MKTYHYVYRIINNNPTDNRKFYIGVRSCKNCLPDEDIKYMSSSKYVKEAINDLGINNFSKEILSVWDSREAAITEEIRLHEKYDVAKNENFYNKSKQTSSKFDTTGTNAGQKANESRLKNINSEGLNVNQQTGLIQAEKWKDPIWRKKTTKRMRQTKNDPNWKKTTGKQAVKKMLKKRNDPNNPYCYKKTVKKILDTKNKIGKNGKTVNQIAGEKASKTKSSKQWKNTVGKQAVKKMMQTKANNGTLPTGSKNPNAKTFQIFDNNGNLIFEVKGRFKQFCKDNKLPYNALYHSSIKNGDPIFCNGKVSITLAKKNGYEHFIGWYCKKC